VMMVMVGVWYCVYERSDVLFVESCYLSMVVHKIHQQGIYIFNDRCQTFSFVTIAAVSQVSSSSDFGSKCEKLGIKS
jgi:hypothetical protein